MFLYVSERTESDHDIKTCCMYNMINLFGCVCVRTGPTRWAALLSEQFAACTHELLLTQVAKSVGIVLTLMQGMRSIETVR